MDFISVPFGYLLEWLYRFAGDYGMALILFSIAVKLLLAPFTAKSKKSTNTPAENIAEESSTTEAETEQQMEATEATDKEQQTAPKPKSRRRRTAKSKEYQAKANSAQTEAIINSSNSEDNASHQTDIQK